MKRLQPTPLSLFLHPWMDKNFYNNGLGLVLKTTTNLTKRKNSLISQWGCIYIQRVVPQVHFQVDSAITVVFGNLVLKLNFLFWVNSIESE